MLFDGLTDECQLLGREVLLQLALGYGRTISGMPGCAHITLSRIMEYYRCSLCRCQLLAFYDLCVSVDVLYMLPLVVCVIRPGYLLELLSIEGSFLLGALREFYYTNHIMSQPISPVKSVLKSVLGECVYLAQSNGTCAICLESCVSIL